MRIEDIPDLATLDAAIAKTNSSPEEKLKLKLDVILRLPQLHQPFLDWIDAYWNGMSGDAEANSFSKLKDVFNHMQLWDEAQHYALSFVAAIPALASEVFPDEAHDSAMTVRGVERDPIFRLQNTEILSFQEAKKYINQLTDDQSASTLQLVETVCLHPEYVIEFLREISIITGKHAIAEALGAFLENKVSDESLVRQALLLASRFIPPYDMILATGTDDTLSEQAEPSFFDLISLNQVDALSKESNSWRSIVSRLRIIILSHSLQKQFMQRVDAFLPDAIPFRVKLHRYLAALASTAILSECSEESLVQWRDFFIGNAQLGRARNLSDLENFDESGFTIEV